MTWHSQSSCPTSSSPHILFSTIHGIHSSQHIAFSLIHISTIISIYNNIYLLISYLLTIFPWHLYILCWIGCVWCVQFLAYDDWYDTIAATRHAKVRCTNWYWLDRCSSKYRDNQSNETTVKLPQTNCWCLVFTNPSRIFAYCSRPDCDVMLQMCKLQ